MCNRRFATATMLLVFLTACGRGGPETATVSGKVTFQGRPVENGKIRLIPAEGTIGPVSGARIENGQYLITNKGGVPIGKHRVEIEAFMQRGSGESKEQVPGTGGGEWMQYIPPKYNARSELTFVVESGSGQVTYDFELKN